jgi:hypothetical protein
MNGKNWKSLGLFWLLAGLALMGLLAAASGRNGLPLYYALMREGVSTQAQVARVEKDNHCRTEYRFSAAGASYEGAGVDCSAQTGQTRVVTYLRSDPARSVLGEPREGLTSELLTLLLAALVLPPLGYWLWGKWSRPKAQSCCG